MKYRYVNLFSGIGGWELGLAGLPMENVLSCEIDKYARETFLANFAHLPCVRHGNYPTDVRTLDPAQMPDFDILIASFPCQSFSMAGKRLGLCDKKDDKGEMFLQVLRILKARRPRAFILENVKGLLTAERGRSFRIIGDLFRNAGYSFHYRIIKGSDCGVPQMRQRLFMVGFRGEEQEASAFSFPAPVPLKYTMSDILGGNCPQEIGNTILTTRTSHHYGEPHNWMCYMVDGVERKIALPEIRRMMDFPESFVFPVSENQQYKQLGNAVIPAVVRAVAGQVLKNLQRGYKEGYNRFAAGLVIPTAKT